MKLNGKLDNFMFCRNCHGYNILERSKYESSQVDYIVFYVCVDCKQKDQCTIRKIFYADWRTIKEGELLANRIPIPFEC